MITRAKHSWKLLQTGDAKGILAGLAAHSGQISVGLSQGFSAILIPRLLESNFATTSEASWVAALGVVSNPLGALVAGLSAEWFGRRSAVALATLPHAAGWLLIALSRNVSMLYTGRFISGIGTGMANGLYLYVSEAAAPHQRAWLASFGPVLVSLGVLIVYTLGALTTWQRTAAISIGPAILSLALTRMLPETPAWLAARGRTKEAEESLLWLRGPGISTETEYRELCTIHEKREMKKESLFKSLHMPNVWKPFLILFFFFAIQQLSGIYVILFYAVSLLEDLGLTMDEYVGSVGIGVIRLFAAIFGAVLARSLGRKCLACISALGMALAASGVAVSVRYYLWLSWCPLVCIGCHVGASMLGYLTLPWVMTSELYPLRFRGTLGGLTTSIAQILTFAAIKTYPDMNSSFGLEATMWIFAGTALIGAIFALVVLPETRGHSLDEIESKFNNCDDKKKEYPSKISNIANHYATKEITLKRYTSIDEEKLSNIAANAFVYNNMCLDLSMDQDMKKPENEISSNKICTISLEYAYL